jgi:hypothetical protein
MARVSDLKKIVDGKRSARALEEARDRDDKERKKLIDEAPEFAPMDFWCGECKEDFSCMGEKFLATGYDLDAHQSYITFPRRARYVGYCRKKRHACYRLITDKLSDPYYRESENLRRQQWQFRDAFLTPADSRFKTVYPVQWARIEKEMEERAMMGGI